MGRHDTHECQVQKLYRRRVHKKVHLYFNIWLVFFSPILSLSLRFSFPLAGSKTANDAQGCQEHLCYLTTYCPLADVLRGRDLRSCASTARTMEAHLPDRYTMASAVPALLQPLFFILPLAMALIFLRARARGAKRSRRTYLSPARTAIV